MKERERERKRRRKKERTQEGRVVERLSLIPPSRHISQFKTPEGAENVRLGQEGSRTRPGLKKEKRVHRNRDPQIPETGERARGDTTGEDTEAGAFRGRSEGS